RAIESREVGQRAHIEHSADQDPGFLRPRIHRYPWAGKYGDDGRDHAAPRLPPAPSSPAFAADDSDRHHAAGRLDGVRRPPLARHRGARRRPQDHLGRRADPRLPDGERAHDGSGQMAGRSGRSDRIRARRVAGRHPRPESHFLRGRYRPEGCECSVPAALRDLSTREGVVRQIAAADGVRLANREAGVAPRFRLGTRVQDWSAARELLRRAVLERLDERVDAAIWGELWRLAAPGGRDGRGQLVYIKSGVPWARYSKMEIDPVTIWTSGDSDVASGPTCRTPWTTGPTSCGRGSPSFARGPESIQGSRLT